ncbi:MAG: hypothetical protein KDB53_14345, partial [Planctomycetes bacterium]|nr:hypothetical protein [Planctomycetota bacterium]
ETLVTQLGARENGRTLRRLAIAAREGQCLALLLRPAEAALESSPAPLRLLARPDPVTTPQHRGVQLEVLKCESRPYLPPHHLRWTLDALHPATTPNPTPPAAKQHRA